MHKHFLTLAMLIAFASQSSAQVTIDNAEHKARPVVVQDEPREGYPAYLGVEIGSGLTLWQNSTPTFFATNYPYSRTADTIHVRFPSGATPLFGFFFGVSGDFWLDTHWAILAKFNYNERRGNWNATTSTEADIDGTSTTVPVTNDLTYMLRALSLEAYAKYRMPSDLYLGAGLALSAIANDHYDLQQTISAPANVSFRDLSSGQGTGIQQYGIGGSFGNERTFLELKLLAGMPFAISSRWTINPEIEIGYPLTSIWGSDATADYQANGISAPPSPITFTGLLAFRYRYR